MDTPKTNSVASTTGRNDSASGFPLPPTAPANQVEIDDSETMDDYANFCRLSGAPEELLMDFGLNPNPMVPTTQPVQIKQRIVTGWHTAKRVARALQTAVERHEAAFGVLETDVQKRIRKT